MAKAILILQQVS